MKSSSLGLFFYGAVHLPGFNVVGCGCLNELPIWTLSHVEKGQDNNFFVPHSIEQPCLSGKLKTSNISVFDLSHCRIILKESENFVSLDNKLLGCPFSSFIFYKVND